MRDPNRLDVVYESIKEIHKKSFPDMRFGQFMVCFMGWVFSNKRDPFFPECNEFINYAKEYANSNSALYQDWEIEEKQ